MSFSDRVKRILTIALGDQAAADALETDIENLTTAEIGALAVTTAKIALLAVDTPQLAALAVEEAKIGALAVTNGKLGLLSVDTPQIEALAVEAAKIGAGAVEKAKIAVGVRPEFILVVAEDADTSSREENAGGLISAIDLANALTITMDAHAADAAEHTAGADAVSFPLASPAATDLTDMITLVTEQLLAYQAHNADAVLGALWAFHAAQQAGNALASAVAPTTLEECVTRLNDIKAKYNTHESSAVSHGAGSAHTEVQADGAYGAANLFPVPNVLFGDVVSWSILDDGSGSVTGVSAVAGAAGITFTFSADPQNDTIISYQVFRATT